jgi:hypothetical protein
MLDKGGKKKGKFEIKLKKGARVFLRKMAILVWGEGERDTVKAGE